MCWSAGTVKKRYQLEKAAARLWREREAVPRPRTTSFALENGHCSGNGASGPPSVRRESERHLTSSGKAVSTLYPSQSVPRCRRRRRRRRPWPDSILR